MSDGGSTTSVRLELMYDEMRANGWEPEVCFEPMLPRVYDIMLPSLDAKLNLINVGRRHAAVLRHMYGSQVKCRHSDVLQNKVRLLTAILTKLLDINGILEKKDSV
uniref:DNA packaging protein UL33 n=1 Tax=Hipposideros bat herpesvirus TaxID=3141919 RepID=A0AAU7E1Z4_9VIRU